MAQYDKLINLSLLNQFLTKAKTIFAPKITASGILKGDGAGNVSAATAGTDYATPSQSLALGLTGASVGDLVRVNAVDANGKPTSWKRVPLNEIKCNKNLLDNWYFVGGGSQLGDGVFPINQRLQTVYSDTGYGIDRWVGSNDLTATLSSSGITIANTNTTARRTINQILNSPNDLRGKTVTGSILINGGRLYSGTVNIPSGIPSSTTSITMVYVVPGIELLIENRADGKIKMFIMIPASTSIMVQAVKLELGYEQTLAHNEGTEQNPVWVLNEVPDYGEELRKCQRYFVRLNGSSNIIGSGFVQDSTSARMALPMQKMAKNSPTVTINGTMYIQVQGHAGTSSLPISTIVNSGFNNRSLFFIAGGLSGLTPGQGCLMQIRDNTSYIDISAEPK